MADTWLWGDNQDLAWGDGEMMLSSGVGGGDAPVSQAPIATQSSGGYAAKVRAKWEEIEAIERHIQAKEEAEREKVRKQEEAKRQLAELEEKKRQTKTIAERRRK